MDKRNHTQPPAVTLDAISLEAQHSRNRRKITGIGVGAPILMTLASKQVLAGQCLSNMLSGNVSDPDRGNCSMGWSPGGWGQPGGMIHSYTTLGAWEKAGYFYGTLVSSGSQGRGNGKDEYSGGSLVRDTPFLAPADKPDLTMREALTDKKYKGSLLFHLMAAWLNAKLSENDPSFQYVLTPEQVVGLASGTINLPPGYSDLQSFLDSTY